MRVSTHKWTFALVSLLSLAFWITNLHNRVLLGKHTVDQVVIGSQLGIWCAFFSHFVLRDPVFKHVTKLTHGKPGDESPLSRAQATKYVSWGFVCVLAPLLCTMVIGLTMQALHDLE